MEPRHGARYEEILALALATEEAGFDAFFRSDHLMGVDPNDPSYRPTDCWTTLGGLARDTSRVRLGSLVTPVTFREPGLLAAIVASVDDMSGGRVELGLGTGWYEREHHAFGIPFPARAERFDRLEEQLAVISGLWSGPGFSFAGAHHRIDDNRTPPRPVQRPHPPIIVGGSGPKRTPAIAARFATEFNGALTAAGGAAGLRERFAGFARACETIGRDPADARLSAVLPVACGATQAETARRAAVIGSELMRANAAIGSPAQVVERIGELTDAGADTVYLHIYDIHDLDHIALIGAEVLPHVALSRTGATT
ncbi:F420-dependent oxidoreductase-like protein [Pseudonocardia hierapolitana]|uniref:F420-dependent oxidoreductase-like protein n=1 Tax=Pseudonocardia hierapolitana TaxID=1128676 RepID=A0A561T110_9PSEU|nr:TIGR03560 family F420-dependent LLM class oxidoreductase [Pseudonocardia hierapolitana]TWF80804.1 F420-dependent oxidoreductase-like protein [Pseudonocardia hierapolitana]